MMRRGQIIRIRFLEDRARAHKRKRKHCPFRKAALSGAQNC